MTSFTFQSHSHSPSFSLHNNPLIKNSNHTKKKKNPNTKPPIQIPIKLTKSKTNPTMVCIRKVTIDELLAMQTYKLFCLQENYQMKYYANGEDAYDMRKKLKGKQFPRHGHGHHHHEHGGGCCSGEKVEAKRTGKKEAKVNWGEFIKV